MKILVAEDEALIRLDLVEMLREAGYEVVAEAGNGQEAIDLNLKHSPDLAILDINMPIMDGLTAAETIVKSTPVLMLTAFSQRELVERANAAGVMAYVVKPFTINDLIPAIEIAASRYTQMSALADEVTNLNDRLETRKLIDRAKGILMQLRGMTESEAYHAMRKMAMDRNIRIVDVAQKLLAMNDLLA